MVLFFYVLIMQIKSFVCLSPVTNAYLLTWLTGTAVQWCFFLKSGFGI